MIAFSTDKPIYKQTIEYFFNCILSGQWIEGGKIPSVRELALALTVNTHTVLKALDLLQQQQVIMPKRGMGYFLEPNAKDIVRTLRRQEFFNSKLPEILNEMRMLGITLDEIISHAKSKNL